MVLEAVCLCVILLLVGAVLAYWGLRQFWQVQSAVLREKWQELISYKVQQDAGLSRLASTLMDVIADVDQLRVLQGDLNAALAEMRQAVTLQQARVEERLSTAEVKAEHRNTLVLAGLDQTSSVMPEVLEKLAFLFGQESELLAHVRQLTSMRERDTAKEILREQIAREIIASHDRSHVRIRI